MKAKYNGLTCFIIFAVAGIFLVIYGVMLSDKIAGTIQISRPPSISDIKVPDESVMAYIDFLTPQLPAISKAQDPVNKVRLNLLGFSEDPIQKTDIKNTDNTDTALVNAQTNRLSYVLTLSFTSPKKNFCMIDNKLYSEKNSLPDGGKILKIETGRVLILKNSKKQWLYPLPQ